MNAVNYDDFAWGELLRRIERRNVIPVIGQGLYRVEIESKGKGDYLLYDYLAERVLEECGANLHPEENHKFAKACLEFLKKNNNDYPVLSDFLKDILVDVLLIPDNSVWKLARIKRFDVFINTAYDDFLTDTIETVRNNPTEVRCYTLGEKDLTLLGEDLFVSLEKSRRTLVYHILGNMKDCLAPAYTEKDILENIVAFLTDMEINSKNMFSRKMKSSSLLFMGCGYDDWLFRFFIRSVTNKPYEFVRSNQNYNFVEGNFFNKKRDPFQELPKFLKNYEVEVFYYPAGSGFVDMLFEKFENKYPDEIIQLPDFPCTAFISFEGKDRSVARRLARNLRKDGIAVWLDEKEFKGGDEVDEIIIKAIDKCPAFIPLISQNSQQIQTENEKKLKYHIREWERAYANFKAANKKVTIIPVIIDGTVWKYDKFSGLFHYDIPGGKKSARGGNCEKLINHLSDIQRKKQN